nr:ribonuclease H-like domain-containing protein [Tanacetum cinerariifolium]
MSPIIVTTTKPRHYHHYQAPPPPLDKMFRLILNGDYVTTVASASVEGPIPPKTTEQKLARKNELKANSTLILAILDEHLLKFHACKDEKSLWKAIKNRFEGNKESKKMQNTILKQNYENFAASSQEGLHKTYDSIISSDNTSNTNETVNTTHNVPAASSKDQASTASYADDIDTDDLEEMDLKWQVAMLTMRVKRFIQKTRRKLDLNGKETVGFNRTKVECYNCHRRGHFARECRAPRNQMNRNRDAPTRNAPVDTSTINALVIQDGIKSLEARIVIYEKNKAVYEKDIAFLKYDVQVKDIYIKDLKNQLENALKEKDDLKLKLEKFETSSKNLTKLIDSQISATDMTGLGYEGHVNESEVLNNVVDSCESDRDDNQVNDRFKKSKGYHVVPPPYTGTYMPPRANVSFAGLDDSVFKSKVSETVTSVSKIKTNASKTSKDSLEKPKTVRSSAPIIED